MSLFHNTPVSQTNSATKNNSITHKVSNISFVVFLSAILIILFLLFLTDKELWRPIGFISLFTAIAIFVKSLHKARLSIVLSAAIALTLIPDVIYFFTSEDKLGHRNIISLFVAIAWFNTIIFLQSFRKNFDHVVIPDAENKATASVNANTNSNEHLGSSSGYWSKLLKAICLVLEVLVILLPLWMIGMVAAYFVMTGAFINSEAMLAILQTNLGEAFDYLKAHCTPGTIATTVLFLGIIIYAIFFILKKDSCMETLFPAFGIKTSAKEDGFSLNQYCYSNGRARLILKCFLALSSVIFMCQLLLNGVYGSRLLEVAEVLKSFNDFYNMRSERIEMLHKYDINSDSGDNGVYVVVVGESETRAHMGAYGYERNTTPWLSSEVTTKDPHLTLFTNAYSCHVNTTSAWSYAFTRQNQYNKISPSQNFSLLEVAKEAGYNIAWISNQLKFGVGGNAITVLSSPADQQLWSQDYFDIGKKLHSFRNVKPDGEFLPAAFDNISYSSKMLIIVHLFGSHEIYKYRIPKDFKGFQGAGANKNVDMYDSTVLYTDGILKLIYDRVKSIPNFKAMVYMSDHGEYPEDNSGHNFSGFHPNMTRIPFLVFTSDSFMTQYPNKIKALTEMRNSYFTSDLFFNFMLDLIDLKVAFAEPQNTLLSPAVYDGHKERFRTVWGQKKLDEK